jgi:ActR/RegA family two-component response regulator
MGSPGMDVLLVGPDFKFGQSLPDRLHQWGFRCQFACTARMAYELTCSQQIDVVLATTHLPDGSGFGLVESLSGLAVTAFLCLPVEDSCFWLPAIDRGRVCLGSPALRPAEFARVIKALSRQESYVAERAAANGV